MKKISTSPGEINRHLYSLIVPSNILLDFEIERVEEKEETLFVYLVEKQENKPPCDEDLVLNGYMNPVEIQSFPIQGKACFLHLKRRRWKKRGTKEDLFNTYKYTEKACKTTPDFGAFLKEINL